MAAMNKIDVLKKNGVKCHGKEQNTSSCLRKDDAYELPKTRRGFANAGSDRGTEGFLQVVP